MQKKIRILFAIGSMGGGGAEQQVLAILKHLDRTRFEPLLYLVYYAGELLSDIPEDVPVFTFDQRHPQLPRINWPGRIHGMRVRDMADVIREQQIDIVYDRTYHMTLISGPATKITETKRISVVVSDPQKDLIHYETRFRRTKRRLLRKIYQSAHVVLTVSEGLREKMIKYYGLPDKLVRTIFNPIDIDRIDRLATESTELLSDSKFHVVSCGRLHTQKGYVYLIDAIHQLVNIRKHDQLQFHIIGEGPLQEELSFSIRQLGLEQVVHMKGFQMNPFPLLKQAQLFCLPSLFEGLPNTLLEAMVCRVPVLATDCPHGPREILKQGELGQLVPLGNPMALADAIEETMLNYDKWQALVPAARKQVEETFSLKIGMQKHEELFLELYHR